MDIKMSVYENTNFNATVTINNEGIDTPVMYLGATLDANLNININCNVANRDLYKAYAAEMKEKYNEFKDLVKKETKGFGYEIF